MLRYALLTLFLVLVGCCPVQQNAVPTVAVLNAPSENSVLGLAEQFERSLVKQPEAIAFGLSSRDALRYQETHRGMSGSRAPMQAAFSARSQGALYAVMLGFDTQSVVTDIELIGERLEIHLELSGQLEATIVGAQGADVLGTFRSPTFTRRGLETHSFKVDPNTAEGKAELDSLKAEALDDPLAAFSGANFEDALKDLSQPVAAELARLVTASAQTF